MNVPSRGNSFILGKAALTPVNNSPWECSRIVGKFRPEAGLDDKITS